MCICVYVYMCVYIYIYIHTYIHTYIYIPLRSVAPDPGVYGARAAARLGGNLVEKQLMRPIVNLQ